MWLGTWGSERGRRKPAKKRVEGRGEEETHLRYTEEGDGDHKNVERTRLGNKHLMVLGLSRSSPCEYPKGCCCSRRCLDQEYIKILTRTVTAQAKTLAHTGIIVAKGTKILANTGVIVAKGAKILAHAGAIIGRTKILMRYFVVEAKTQTHSFSDGPKTVTHTAPSEIRKM